MNYSILENFRVETKVLAKKAKGLKKYVTGTNYILAIIDAEVYLIGLGNIGTYAKLLKHKLETTTHLYFTLSKEDIKTVCETGAKEINFSIQTKDAKHILELSCGNEQIFLEAGTEVEAVSNLLNMEKSNFIFAKKDNLEKIYKLAKKLQNDTTVAFTTITFKAKNTYALNVEIEAYDVHLEVNGENSIVVNKTVLEVEENKYSDVNFTFDIKVLEEVLKSFKLDYLIIHVDEKVITFRGLATDKLFWAVRCDTATEYLKKKKNMAL